MSSVTDVIKTVNYLKLLPKITINVLNYKHIYTSLPVILLDHKYRS